MLLPLQRGHEVILLHVVMKMKMIAAVVRIIIIIIILIAAVIVVSYHANVSLKHRFAIQLGKDLVKEASL